MPIPENVMRVVYFGECNLTRDEWNIVHYFQGSNDFDNSDLAGLAHDLYDVFHDDIWHSSTTESFFNDSSNLGGCSAYSLDTGGHVLDMATYTPGSPEPGAHTGALPSEVAIVLTWLTARDGRSYRGRSYLPGISTAAVNADGVMATATTEALAAAGAQYLVDANLLSYGTGGAASMHFAVLSNKKETTTAITECKVGNVFDVQRRRRNGAVEEYSVA
jgi:hypothetical protein